MLYFFFISSAIINIINVNWTIKTFCIFTEMNCLFNNIYRNKTSKIFPSHIIPFLVSSLYSDTQNYPPSLSSFYWSWWWDSNSQPIDYKSIALPLRHISKYNSNNRQWLVAVPVLLSDTSFLVLPVYIPPLAHQTAIFVVGFEKESHVMYCQLPQYEARLWTGGACRWTRTNYLWRMKPSLIHISFTGKS